MKDFLYHVVRVVFFTAVFPALCLLAILGWVLEDVLMLNPSDCPDWFVGFCDGLASPFFAVVFGVLFWAVSVGGLITFFAHHRLVIVHV
jgi:hypothetical protein